ncbi:MAG: putative transporter ATP-binding protein [Gammaproteobacteria bacterium]|jgi:phospholipid/cholesterol/gamma-HCH transport system ATP-binding protein|nr:putative transporter ATP-binding protein [Gammaproteobacteria bacterium]
MKNLVEINKLAFQRNNRSIFKDVDIFIPKGKVTAIMGPSGTGKTTLLRLIGGQLLPNKGSIKVAGQEVPTLRRSALYLLRKRIGMLFQTGGLFTHLSVFENVAFPLREHTQLTNAMIRSLVLMKLEMVGLRGAMHLMPSELSGGMARRVALARAIALDPDLIMYDEPFSGQDPISMGVLVKLIRMLNDTLGLTTVIVSHDVQETLSIADYAYVISDGGVIGQGTASSINKDTSLQLQQFLRGLPDGPVAFHYPAPYSLEEDLMSETTDV